MMSRIAPRGGCRIKRMTLLLRRFLLCGLVVLSIGLFSSCAGNHYSRPQTWPGTWQPGEDAGESITGVYRDQGSSSCEWLPPAFRSLSYILEPCLFSDFFPERHLGDADRVEIRKSGEDRIVISVYDTAGKQLYRCPEEGLEYASRPGGILLSYRPKLDTREGVYIVSGTLFLSRGEDGSLICRIKEYRLFCSFIIPAPLISTAYTVWYRFESLDDIRTESRDGLAAGGGLERRRDELRAPDAWRKGDGGTGA